MAVAANDRDGSTMGFKQIPPMTIYKLLLGSKNHIHSFSSRKIYILRSSCSAVHFKENDKCVARSALRAPTLLFQQHRSPPTAVL